MVLRLRAAAAVWTAMSADPVMVVPCVDALMDAVPALNADTSPLGETVATDGLLDDQLNVNPDIELLAESKAVAPSCCVWVGTSVAWLGLTLILFTVG